MVEIIKLRLDYFVETFDSAVENPSFPFLQAVADILF
jgi:hypothetical protein